MRPPIPKPIVTPGLALVTALVLAAAPVAQATVDEPTPALALSAPSPAAWRFARHVYTTSPKDDPDHQVVWGRVAAARLAHRRTELLLVLATQGDCMNSWGCRLSIYELNATLPPEK